MALRFDSNGWLVPGSDPNIKVNLDHRIDVNNPDRYINKTDPWVRLSGGSPLGVVWHWSGGANRNIWPWLIKEAVNPERRASWHFSVGRDGEIAQHAPLTRSTWHAGCDPKKANCGTVTAYFNNKALPPIRTASANSYFLGVELENAGILRKQNDQWYAWPYAQSLLNCSGRSQCSETGALGAEGVKFESNYLIPNNRVMTVNGKTYEIYPTAQVRSATALAQAMKDALGWTRPEQIHYGHSQFIDQKLDPGDLWMQNILPDIERKVFGSSAGGLGVGTFYAVTLSTLALAGGLFLWKRRGGRFPSIKLPKLTLTPKPQVAAPALNGTVGGDMSILNGILNGGFFTGHAIPAGFGNLEALPPIDGTHSPFKRSAELPGTNEEVTPAPRERKQAERWECEWQPIGTGRPNPKAGEEGEPAMLNTLAKSKVGEYISEQICTPIGDEVEKHSEGYKKIVRIKKKTKQRYNKKYKKLMKEEEEEDGIESRGFPQKRQESYKYRKTAWPKFENNPAFAARMKREEKAATKAAEEAAAAKAVAAEKKAKAPKKAKAEKPAAEPKKAAKGKKAASA